MKYGKILLSGAMVLLLTTGMSSLGCKGKTGEAGTPALDKGIITGTVNDSEGSPIEGATATTYPVAAEATTDADGRFTIAYVPIGVYQVFASATGYNSAASEFIGVAAGQTVTVNFALSLIQPTNQAPTASIVSQYQVGFGTLVNLSVTTDDPEGDPLTYSWVLDSGPGPTTIIENGVDASFTTISLNDLITLEDRFGIVGIAPDSQGNYEIEVFVSDGASTVEVSATVSPANVSAGIRNVPVGVALYLNSGHPNTNTWTCTDPDSNPCSSSVFSGEDTQTPRFLPDTEGSYILSEGTNSSTISASIWEGIIGQEDLCMTCHDDGFASDQFTSWADTGHANIFSDGIDGIASSHYGSGCIECHTVGYSPAAVNGGFDDIAVSAGWLFPAKLQPGNWTAMQSNYPQVAQLGNIQCENCHGPQGYLPSYTDAHTDSSTSAFESARITFSVSMCAQCHDQPTHHMNVSDWQSSGHADLELAREEATWESRRSSTAHCGRCHAGQGFVKWLPQAEAGNPDNITPFSQAIAIETGLVDALVQPQTCQTCHDSHDETNPHQVRVYDDTPILPAGFSASGMGAGALCIMCHNTRNGWVGGEARLHEDDDLDPSEYRGPHQAAQADVFIGRNAYFMGTAGTPHLSAHANVEDTCAGCHMELNPDGVHVFKIDPAKKAEVCAECHGSTSGEGLKAQVEGLEAQLKTQIESAIEGYLNAEIDDEGEYVLRAWDPETDCYSIESDTSLNVSITVTADRVETSHIHGRMGAIIYFGTNVTVTWEAYDDCVGSTGPTTVIYAQLGSIQDTEGGEIIPSDGDIVKAMWNLELIEGDSSFGVHNPSFVVEVLWNSIQKAVVTP